MCESAYMYTCKWIEISLYQHDAVVLNTIFSYKHTSHVSFINHYYVMRDIHSFFPIVQYFAIILRHANQYN